MNLALLAISQISSYYDDGIIGEIEVYKEC